MKIVTISDTHGQHAKLQLPAGDVLLHAGDISMKGSNSEVNSFLTWFAKQDFQYKIFIAGNHDFFFERESAARISAAIPPGVIYLNDNGTTINGIKIWGSPVTPWFFDWAFNRHRGAPISRHWDMIPGDTAILITHGPAFGKLDKNLEGEQIGCKDLLLKVEQVNPRVHVCGHIHESYGTYNGPLTKFINASVLNEKYELANQPVVFDFE